jgi:hypothetical protein
MPAFFSKPKDFAVPQAASVFVVDPELVASRRTPATPWHRCA